MVDEFTGPVDKSEWGMRTGSGPKQYVREDGQIRVVAVRDRGDAGIDSLLKGISQSDLRGPKTGLSRFANERGGWKIEGTPGAGDREEPYPQRDHARTKDDDYSADSDVGEHNRGDEEYEPQFDVDLLMQPEDDYRETGGEPREEGDFLVHDNERARPAQQDITDFEDLVSMDVFEDLERGYGGNQDDVPRATTRQGPSPGDYHPPRSQPRTYRKKTESILDEIENLFEED